MTRSGHSLDYAALKRWLEKTRFQYSDDEDHQFIGIGSCADGSVFAVPLNGKVGVASDDADRVPRPYA